MPTTILNDASLEAFCRITMKWKEPFVTDGLNSKFAVAEAKGVYRGWRLATNGSGFQVLVQADPTFTDHVAVQESQTGKQLTFHATGGNFILDLTPVSNSTVILVIQGSYAVGSNTTGTIVAYGISEWNSLTLQQQSEFVVLGTVVVPNVGPIPAANVTHDRRTGAWQQVAQERVPWSTLIRNPSFEQGPVGAVQEWAADFWDCELVEFSSLAPISSSAGFKLVTTTPNSGTKCLEFDYVAASTGIAWNMTQRLNVPVTPGQLLKYRINVYAVQAVTAGGPLNIFFEWRDQNGAVVTPANDPTNNIAGALSPTGQWLQFVKTVTVPAGVVTLSRFGLQSVAHGGAGDLQFGADGPALRFDDFQIWAETNDPLATPASNSKESQELLKSTIFEDPDSQYNDTAAVARFTNSTELSSTEGALSVFNRTRRRDIEQSQNILPVGPHPILDWLGRVFIGRGMMDSAVHANAPKILLPYPTVAQASTTFTLLAEATQLTSAFGINTTAAAQRLYVYSGAIPNAFYLTQNAFWTEGTGWQKDVSGQAATKYVFGANVLASADPGMISISVKDPAVNTAWFETLGPTGWTYTSSVQVVGNTFQINPGTNGDLQFLAGNAAAWQVTHTDGSLTSVSGPRLIHSVTDPGLAQDAATANWVSEAHVNRPGNYIMNGSFAFNQRWSGNGGAQPNVDNTHRAFVSDRWWTVNSPNDTFWGTLTGPSSTNEHLFGIQPGVFSGSRTTTTYLVHEVDRDAVQMLQGRTVYLGFNASRGSSFGATPGSSITVSLISGVGGGSFATVAVGGWTNFGNTYGTQTTQLTLTQALTTTNTTYQVGSVQIPSNVNFLAVVVQWTPAAPTGADFTHNFFNLNWIRLCEGSAPTDFRWFAGSPASELEALYYYYENSFAFFNDVPNVTQVTQGFEFHPLDATYSNLQSIHGATLLWPHKKRITPNVTFYSCDGFMTSGKETVFAAAGTHTNINAEFFFNGNNGLNFASPGSNTFSNQAIQFHWEADAEI